LRPVYPFKVDSKPFQCKKEKKVEEKWVKMPKNEGRLSVRESFEK
jgi:hypothetical protein